MSQFFPIVLVPQAANDRPPLSPILYQLLLPLPFTLCLVLYPYRLTIIMPPRASLSSVCIALTDLCSVLSGLAEHGSHHELARSPLYRGRLSTIAIVWLSC